MTGPGAASKEIVAVRLRQTSWCEEKCLPSDAPRGTPTKHRYPNSRSCRSQSHFTAKPARRQLRCHPPAHTDTSSCINKDNTCITLRSATRNQIVVQRPAAGVHESVFTALHRNIGTFSWCRDGGPGEEGRDLVGVLVCLFGMVEVLVEASCCFCESWSFEIVCIEKTRM